MVHESFLLLWLVIPSQGRKKLYDRTLLELSYGPCVFKDREKCFDIFDFLSLLGLSRYKNWHIFIVIAYLLFMWLFS